MPILDEGFSFIRIEIRFYLEELKCIQQIIAVVLLGFPVLPSYPLCRYQFYHGIWF